MRGEIVRVRGQWYYLKERISDYIVIPARPPWMAEVLETQEQFPVQAGIQGLKKHRPLGRFWMPAFAGMTAILLWGS
jgi:hypothetical protein